MAALGLSPKLVKAGSGRPPQGLSLPAFTCQHSGKGLRQGPHFAGWGQATLWAAYLGEGRGQWDGGWHILSYLVA